MSQPSCACVRRAYSRWALSRKKPVVPPPSLLYPARKQGSPQPLCPLRLSTSARLSARESFSDLWTELPDHLTPPDPTPEIVDMFESLKAGDRGTLSRAITLVENKLPRRRRDARSLLALILAEFAEREAASEDRTFRVGFSGPPGAGKSTLIEALGTHVVVDRGLSVAVLAVDPSSVTTGGSILGDKTRMPELSRNPMAYVRGSPASGHLGGVAQATSDAILLCECAGYDLVFVETVGVGQSEHLVADMIDAFVLLLPPGGGDELQGLKRGVLERVHFVVVTKADGQLLPAARRMQYEYTSALKYLRPVSAHWKARVSAVSAYEGSGVVEMFDALMTFKERMMEVGEFDLNRRRQKEAWMWSFITDAVIQVFKDSPDVRRWLPAVRKEVRQGTLTPHHASDILLEVFRQEMRNT